jgi:hypothetical protein
VDLLHEMPQEILRPYLPGLMQRLTALLNCPDMKVARRASSAT